jgi:tricorn protease
MTGGYYRYPTIHEDTIVFVSEDDLWAISVQGGIARRLTSNLGSVTSPMLSNDGKQLAFVGREEGGPEVYVMPAEGGSARRLTYFNSYCRIVGWSADNASILFASTYGQVTLRDMALYRIDADANNGAASRYTYGPVESVSFGPGAAAVIGRNTGDPARWKRYRGGTTGQLWIDRAGNGEFERLLPDLEGNIASPMWLVNGSDSRIYFVSDHEGIGNLYSCLPDGSAVLRHTDHDDYYARNPSTDGKRIVYHAGADIYVYDPAGDQSTRVDVQYRSPRVNRNRRFVDAGKYMDGFELHPSGKALAVTTRGKPFAFYNHEGPVLQYGRRDGVRYRHATWLEDGRRLAVVTDEPGEETIEIYGPDPTQAPQRMQNLDLGRIVAMAASPVENKVALSNHRHEFLLVDLDDNQVTVVDKGAAERINGFDWSPDGNWLAYSFSPRLNLSEIRLYRVNEETDQAPAKSSKNGDAAHGQESTDDATDQGDDGETAGAEGGAAADSAAAESGPEAGAEANQEVGGEAGGAGNGLEPDDAGTQRRFTVTQPVLHDVRPAFDPDGRYLYFISHREFNPVYDGLHFDLGFPWGMRPYLITLQADHPNPFTPRPDFDDEGYSPDDGDDDDGDNGDDDAGDGDGPEDASPATDDYAEGTTSESDAVAQADEVAPQGETGKISASQSGKKRTPPKSIRIDLEGIERRVTPFPVPDARYGQVLGVPGKALFTVFPIEGTLDAENLGLDEEAEEGALRAYDFKEYKVETLLEGISEFALSRNGKKLVYRTGRRLRVINAGDKPQSNGGPRKTGWVDLKRVKVSVDPQSEWEQMFREAWRLQRDQFWTEDMSQVDWHTVYERYFALIERVSTRGEFSDLMWEMQGELGTSHAYEFGGDYRPRPSYGQGFLGADLIWDDEAGGYRVGEILHGDPWDERNTSPLSGPGIDVEPGDLLLAVNGQRLDADTSPAQLLVNQAGNEVLLTFAKRDQDDQSQDVLDEEVFAGNGQDDEGSAAEDSSATETAHDDAAALEDSEGSQDDDVEEAIPLSELDDKTRSFVVRSIVSETAGRYRHWVEQNRAVVHAATDGRVGYVHIPDMGPKGYAEFHRGYLAENDRDALIVDVRYNGGGHVSQLILEKLARRRLGYDLSRWGGLIPYPAESVAGPLLALTNEHAGSDGDIFCHSFKLMKLGPLVGKRTWGGVIGIYPRHALVDGTITTQPEYSFWFQDVGWNVENYGTDPDIEVDITPQAYAAGEDPQLTRSIEEILRLLEEHPVARPTLGPRPSRALPALPPRTPR